MGTATRMIMAALGGGLLSGAASLVVKARKRGALPQTSGTLRIAGLRGPVEVLRDAWGSPHIYAQDEDDLFFAQGFVHAQDRLWQMDFCRRLGHGRLSELLGPQALEPDRIMRTFGLGRASRAEVALLDAQERRLVDAYIAGVNALIAQLSPSKLPFEYALFFTRPEPWRIEDSIVWGKVMALAMAGNWETELLRAQMITRLGPEVTALLEPGYPAGHPVTAPWLAGELGQPALQRSASLQPYLGRGGEGGNAAFGSNAWAVGGARSATGGPLLANDPHLTLMLPSLWYDMHLNGGGMHVTGASMPGVPGIIAGHNEDIAWGVTNACCDVQDLYIERFDRDSARYATPDGWHEAQVIREEIKVRGRRKPDVLEILETRHGPVISALSPLSRKRNGKSLGKGERLIQQGRLLLEPDDLAGLLPDASGRYGLALRWTALNSRPNMRGIIALNKARSWQEFRAALGDWFEPALNMVYADRHGHIGYALAGAVPQRRYESPGTPLPGWSNEYEWDGLIPPAELPASLDPPSGYVASANNQITTREYPHHLSHEWSNGYRVRRIGELIEQQDRLDLDDFARMQVDFYCRPGHELAALAGKLLGDLPDGSPIEREALARLRAWDGQLSADSVAGAIYQALLGDLQRLVFGSLGDLLPAYLGESTNPLFGVSATTLGRTTPLLLDALRAGNSLPFGGDEPVAQIVRQSFGRAVGRLRRQLGDDLSRWQWGRIHQAFVVHALGDVRPFSAIFNRGPFPSGGDADTLCQMSYTPIDAYKGKAFGAGYRQLCDPLDWDRSLVLTVGGASGHLGSPHYDDQLALWRRGELRPMAWSRARVEALAKERLLLVAEGAG